MRSTTLKPGRSTETTQVPAASPVKRASSPTAAVSGAGVSAWPRTRTVATRSAGPIQSGAIPKRTVTRPSKGPRSIVTSMASSSGFTKASPSQVTGPYGFTVPKPGCSKTRL